MAGPSKELTARRRLAVWLHRRLARLYPAAGCTLDFADPLDLWVATILSAQCTDARVNQVTPELFAACRTPGDYLALGQQELERRIHSTGFYRNKAKAILGGCARMIEAFDGRVPDTMEDLLTIPGVGRKTANVILGTAFGKAEGVVVDTHVARLSQRMGLTPHTDPVKIEGDLISLFPRKDWTILSHRLILHGRSLCPARSPRCGECPLAERCAHAKAGGGSAHLRPAASRRSRSIRPS